MNAMAMLVDTSQCIGCRACQVACKQWNGIAAESSAIDGNYEHPSRLTGKTWRRVRFIEVVRGEAPMLWLFLTDSCKHCTDAGCMTACPTGAIKRSEFGAVQVDADVCNGCRACIPACPFGVMSYEHEQGMAQKCNFCPDRVSHGRETACAEVCPTDAITFGPRERLLEAAQQRVDTLRGRGVVAAQVYGRDEYGGLGVLHVLEHRPAIYGLPERPPAVGITLIVDTMLAIATALMTAGIVIAGIGNGWNRVSAPLAWSGAVGLLVGLLAAFAGRRSLASYAGGDPAMRAQSPDWAPWIHVAFLLSAVSGGAFFLAALNEFFAPERWTIPITTYGYAIAFLTLPPCLICLVLHLGRRGRLLHFLLAFKPGSAHSVGAWSLLLFSGLVTWTAFLTWSHILPFQDHVEPVATWLTEAFARKRVGLIGVVPAAIAAGYGGVLLGATYRPVWMQSRVLGGLFFVSGVFAANAAIQGMMRFEGLMFGQLHQPLGWIGLWTGAIQILLLVAMLVLLGPWGNDVISGKRALPYWIGVMGLGIAAPFWFHNENVASDLAWRELGNSHLLMIIGSLIGAGMLRWLIVSAGQIERTPPRRPLRLPAPAEFLKPLAGVPAREPIAGAP